MILLLAARSAAAAVALGASPGCPAALAAVDATPDAALVSAAPSVLARLEAQGAGGPSGAIAEAAEALRGASGPDAARRFRAALAAHCALAAQPPLPAASAADRALLARILADPAYHRAPLDPGALRRRLLGIWDRLLEALGSTEAERYAGFGRALFLGVAAAAAAAWWWVARRRGAARTEAPARQEPAAPGEDGPVADGDLGPAESAAARGDAAEAVRLALHAAMAALERAGAAPPAHALTNAELVARARAGEGAGDLRALVAAFDRAVYGRRAVSAGEARTALEAARRLGARAGGGRGAHLCAPGKDGAPR